MGITGIVGGSIPGVGNLRSCNSVSGSSYGSGNGSSNGVDIGSSNGCWCSYGVDIRDGCNLSVDVRFSGNLDIDVRFSGNVFVNVRFSGDIFVNVRLSGNIFMNVRFSGNVFMNIRDGSRVNLSSVVIRVHNNGGSMNNGGRGVCGNVSVSGDRGGSVGTSGISRVSCI